MIVVDTSVWVDALRRGRRGTAETLDALLDADEVALALPVRIELASGVARHQRTPLMRALSGLPVIQPDDDTWARIERWIPEAAHAGERFGLSDLLVAALADGIGGLVWSLDDDFTRMARLGLVRLYGG